MPDEQPLAAPDRAPLGPVELGRAVDPGRERAERLGAHAAFPFATLAGPSSRAAVATRSRCRSRAVRRPSSTSRPHSLTQAASLRAAGHGSTVGRDRAVRDALGDQVVDLLEPAPVRGLDERAGAVVVGRVLPHLVPDRPVGADRGVVAGPGGEQLLDPSAAGADGLELGIGDRIGQVVGVRERLLDHVCTAGEVVVDERRRDAGLAGDVGHAQPRRAGLGDHPAGGVEDGVLAIGGRLGHHCLS